MPLPELPKMAKTQNTVPKNKAKNPQKYTKIHNLAVSLLHQYGVLTSCKKIEKNDKKLMDSF